MKLDALLQRAKVIWQPVYGWCSGWIDRAMLALMGKDIGQDQDFDANADWAIAEQTPRGARVMVWLSAGAVFVMIVWASLATLDEVTRSEEKSFVTAGSNPANSWMAASFQKSSVREGQWVKIGDLMVKVDPTRMVSSLRENRSQYLAVLAKSSPSEGTGGRLQLCGS